jgi:hypothetical protein
MNETVRVAGGRDPTPGVVDRYRVERESADMACEGSYSLSKALGAAA